MGQQESLLGWLQICHLIIFGEVIDAVIAVSKNPDITVLELMENYIQGPDFPTGGYILGKSAIKKSL